MRKNVKKSLLGILVVSFYWFMNVATSKMTYYPCEEPIFKFLLKDSLNRGYYEILSNDTLCIRMINYKDTNKVKRLADTICMIMRDSCKMNGYNILILDTLTNAMPDTRFGKKLYIQKCP